VTIRQLDTEQARSAIPALAEILLDCVAGGASVSFMADVTRAGAEHFFSGVADSVARGERALLVAEDEDSRFIGTVQGLLAMPPNQPHRGEIAKMLVHRKGRRRGFGAALMVAAENAARAAGKSLLVLDTVTDGDGYNLYRRLGWSIAGEIPDFALWPDGRPCPTTFMWKRLSEVVSCSGSSAGVGADSSGSR
jgi:GNAT superfamily N-acetyltransferase